MLKRRTASAGFFSQIWDNKQTKSIDLPQKILDELMELNNG